MTEWPCRSFIDLFKRKMNDLHGHSVMYVSLYSCMSCMSCMSVCIQSPIPIRWEPLSEQAEPCTPFSCPTKISGQPSCTADTTVMALMLDDMYFQGCLKGGGGRQPFLRAGRGQENTHILQKLVSLMPRMEI